MNCRAAAILSLVILEAGDGAGAIRLHDVGGQIGEDVWARLADGLLAVRVIGSFFGWRCAPQTRAGARPTHSRRGRSHDSAGTWATAYW